MSPRQPTYFVSHGGGPYFWINLPPPFTSAEISRMRRHLAGLLDTLPARPSAILLVSAHWEERVPTLNASPAPRMFFDYGRFPEHTYRLSYPAPGNPALAEQAEMLLTNSGISSALDSRRGYDHGVFVPMLIIDPTATIPLVSMSLQRDLKPALHLAVGRALEPLRDDNVLIIGSGNSFHNTRAIYDGRGDADAEVFDAWLTDAVEQPDPAHRSELLERWSTAPHARYAQPREDHLLPLMIAAGAGGRDVGRRAFRDTIAGKPCSAYRFG